MLSITLHTLITLFEDHGLRPIEVKDAVPDMFIWVNGYIWQVQKSERENLRFYEGLPMDWVLVLNRVDPVTKRQMVAEGTWERGRATVTAVLRPYSQELVMALSPTYYVRPGRYDLVAGDFPFEYLHPTRAANLTVLLDNYRKILVNERENKALNDYNSRLLAELNPISEGEE